MRIQFLCNDGSPIGIVWRNIYDRGVGGAELALLSLAEQLVKNGHEVSIYNNPAQPSSPEADAGICFRNLADFKVNDSDRVLVTFRSPSHLTPEAKARVKLWWSTDQFTIGDFSSFSRRVDRIVTISPSHLEYLVSRYGIPRDKIGYFDLGVRDEYDPEPLKIPGRLLFCSVPDRGLACLHAAWALLKKRVPTASLVITSDYRLWGAPAAGNQYHRLMWIDQDDVAFIGMVPREKLVLIQSQSMIQAYPCTYDELFCISTAECQVAGAYPVTSKMGALPTTNQWGTLIDGDPTHPTFVEAFVDHLVYLLTDGADELKAAQQKMIVEARARFSWSRIAKQWEILAETGEFK